MSIEIRFEKMDSHHQEKIMDIFNYYIKTSSSAFPSSPLPPQFYPMLLEKAKSYPAYVVIDEATSETIGFCFLSSYNPFFKKAANVTYFIAPDFVSKGVGKKCFEKLREDAMTMGIEHIIAEISSKNSQSISFHEKLGFYHCGSLKNIGYKFDEAFDIVYMQMDLNGSR